MYTFTRTSKKFKGSPVGLLSDTQLKIASHGIDRITGRMSLRFWDLASGVQARLYNQTQASGFGAQSSALLGPYWGKLGLQP